MIDDLDPDILARRDPKPEPSPKKKSVATKAERVAPLVAALNEKSHKDANGLSE